MAEPFIGEIKPVAFPFAPKGWALCNGQILQITQNTPLYSLIGITYGGDGHTTFALPDLQGRVPIHYGQGPGLSNHNIGTKGGTETGTIDIDHMPAHTHQLTASSAAGTAANPSGNVLASDTKETPYIGGSPTLTQMAADSISTAGGGQVHSNMMPYLVVNFCIALIGLYPQRN